MVAFKFLDEIQSDIGVRFKPVHLTRANDLDMVRPPHSQENVS